ncbi:ESCRT-I component [Histoplasma capsulatum H143]|uniref:ESCRT-I component n=1 Tax=Ajellomyces capsulatus (strain H143) TaxID=544712 RepID=C6HLQ0_AJECH|nr:ESCRT-I component [Histoplasma capsulatum H143]
MAVVPQKTLTWLYRVLTNAEYGSNQAYRDPNRTYNDVTNLLAQYPGFVLRTDVYTYENGTPALLLQLTGTLPVTFRGALYRFPITIWVPKTYPREPPFVYVTPTQDMLVRPGQHRSTIVDLLYILRDVFAKEPPVISKQQQNIRIPTQQNEPPPPVPPLPQELAKTVSPFPPHAQLYQAPPQLPPKPSQVVEPERQQQEHSAQAKYNKPPPPLPPLPNDIGHQRSVSQQRNYDQVSNNHDTYRAPQRSSSLRQPTPQSQMAPQTLPLPPKQGYQQDGYRPTHMGPVSPVPGSNKITPPHIPQAFSHQHQQQPYPPQGPHLQPQIHPAPQTQPLSRPLHVPPYGPPPMSHHTLGPQQPAPPEKKTQSRDPLNSLFELELPSLSSPQIAPLSHQIQKKTPFSSQSQALHAAITTLQSEIASLNSFHSTLQSNTSILQESLQRADGVIADAKSRISTGLSTNVSSSEPSSSSTAAATERQTATGLPAIDDVLVAPTVVGKQIYDLVAEERGIQRAIYALQAGLVKGRVSVETWARLTRGLAREAFLKKALVRKAGLGLGLVVEGDGK